MDLYSISAMEGIFYFILLFHKGVFVNHFKKKVKALYNINFTPPLKHSKNFVVITHSGAF